ncbi:DDE-type integrase/transposase/recombinase [Metabacillus sp. KIGAM252]|uniref:DDE-type integrase/transposase/recombinase n=1 Tax=Metabacillus flavus TaxID=2823519 RepID=A0ABS5LIF6_9BACI|nr:TnsA endonuclease N-terminal domain-containing protein [Metabacillus flavus]MBS2970531.1 DDE-type integrase/transposase/recombinase [Metabacillus flavus]
MNNIEKKTQDFINNNIRLMQPSRNVGGGNVSLTGKYPSKKMGVYIQWESGKVEGPAILMMENDTEVLEYYDQPNQIKLNFVDNSGKRRGVLYTPDFFVIRKSSAGWEEWKNEGDLQYLSSKQPWKYIKDEKGVWRCPPGEEFAKQFGLNFTVCTSEKINWKLHRNYTFLDSYLRKIDFLCVPGDDVLLIREIVTNEPGISLNELIKTLKGQINADSIYTSIIKQSIYVNLNEEVLPEANKVFVYLDKEHATMHKNIIDCKNDLPKVNKISLEVGNSIIWDSINWKIINVGKSTIMLMTEDGKYNELPKDLIKKQIQKGRISSDQRSKEIESDLMEIIIAASESDYQVANYRLVYVREYINGTFKEKEKPSKRLVRDWVSKYRKAEKLVGNGYVGLLPNDKNKGNRTERLSSQVKELMEDFIENRYETSTEKNRSVVWGEFKLVCEEKGLLAPSLQTFCKYIKLRPRVQQIRKRKGDKAAYQEKSFYWELEFTTPRHGDFPFNIAHLDHTELDIELVHSHSGKNLGRPYLTLLSDAYSRKVLAFFLSFEEPSYRSCLMVFRECVRIHNRLPQQIVVDNGKEFHSVYFETLLAMYEKEIKRRPSAQPRYGSVLERMFGTTNTSLIHNLQGNTKNMKNVRQVTKKVNPKNLAIWTLPDLHKALNHFFHEVYDSLEHPSLGLSPSEVFKLGIELSGKRDHEYIPYDPLFEILTLPSTKNGEVVIHTNTGVKINYLYYWNDVFKNPELVKTKVKVRYDPFNMGIAYAYVNKKWVKCISEYYSIFKDLSEKEIRFITTELRKIKKDNSKNYSINASKIAAFINNMEDNIQFEMLQSKANELKKVTNNNYDHVAPEPQFKSHPPYPINETLSNNNEVFKNLELFEEF